MKKNILSIVIALQILGICVVGVYAYSDFKSIGPEGRQSEISIEWSAETVTANNERNDYSSESYCRAYIRYDNGEYIYNWNNGISSASVTTTHSVYPTGATRISKYTTTHRITIDETDYSGSFTK